MSGQGGWKLQVIVAIEPRSYREVIGQAIQILRPHLGVTVLEPSTLLAGVERLDPGIVFANRPDPFAPVGRSAWVEFLPYEEPPARVSLAGQRELEAVEMDDLLSLVDEAEELWRAGIRRRPGRRCRRPAGRRPL